MTLPPILQNALSQMKRDSLAQAEAVTRTTQLEAGRTLMAAVKEISTLSDAERQQALQKLATEVARATTPAGRQPALNQLKQWQNQPQLFLAELKANGRNLYTVTAQQLRPQQIVQLLVRADGQLQIQSAASTQTASTQAAATQVGTTQGGGAAPATWSSIAESLRTTLPYQKSLKNLIQLLAKVSTQVESLPLAQKEAILPKPVQTALGNVQQLSRTPEQLARPDVLQRAISQSGTFLENSLGSTLQKAKQPGITDPASAAPERPVKLSSAQLLAQLQMPLARQAKMAQSQGTADEPQPLGEADIKAALLVAINALQTQHSAAGATLKPAAASESLIFSLLNLLKKLPPRSKDFSENRSLMLQSLQQQVMAVLAKVQTLQLQTLNLRSSESGSPVQGAYVELPIRLPDGFSTIGLSFHEYWKHEEDQPSSAQDDQHAQKRVKQWEVFMEFDLGQYGQLASRLRLVGDSVSASFWAQNDHARAHTRAVLDDLRDELKQSGLEVRDVQCLDGLPPQKTVKFGYNLVDIQT